MQSRTDAALRKLIEGKAPTKVKRESLAAMEWPSSSFLAEIVNGEYPPKLKVDAARRLAKIQQTKQHRQEVDRILAEETERLAKKAARPPEVPIPAPVIAKAKERPENGQAIAPKITVANPTPVPVAAPVHAPAVVPSTAKDPRPVFNLPKGSVLDPADQNLLIEFFHAALNSKTEIQRNGARSQLNRFLAEPSVSRSLFARFLLETIEWYERNPHQPRPKPQVQSPPSQDSETFYFNFTMNRYFQNIAEQERLSKAQRQVKDYVEQGGMWEGI